MSQFEEPVIDDYEIKKRVESIAGKNARIVDCEKKSSFLSEESLLINGVPVKLEGEAGERIKEALKSGQPPPVELLSEILMQAGIEKNPVQLETTMTVKSSTKTSELSTLRDRHGKLVDEKLKEFEEDDEIQSANVEIWERDSDEAKNLRKTFEKFRADVGTFIIPKPLPRTYSSDKTPPKTPQSPQSPTYSMPTQPSSQSQPNNQYYYQPPKQRPTNPPPRIPSLMKPLSKPIPPPKPKSKQVADVLRREKNFELPVRVVYETFI
ncbi:unnamed protein product [Orchesella dallaii]|uniref:Uncharacterized protein n=1 Tax=Orchesella dallaii TaxID=48710 RepID=A0ABP1RFZ0_9HEXA